jgi:hypothetical protein
MPVLPSSWRGRQWRQWPVHSTLPWFLSFRAASQQENLNGEGYFEWLGHVDPGVGIMSWNAKTGAGGLSRSATLIHISRKKLKTARTECIKGCLRWTCCHSMLLAKSPRLGKDTYENKLLRESWQDPVSLAHGHVALPRQTLGDSLEHAILRSLRTEFVIEY